MRPFWALGPTGPNSLTQLPLPQAMAHSPLKGLLLASLLFLSIPTTLCEDPPNSPSVGEEQTGAEEGSVGVGEETAPAAEALVQQSTLWGEEDGEELSPGEELRRAAQKAGESIIRSPPALFFSFKSVL